MQCLLHLRDVGCVTICTAFDDQYKILALVKRTPDITTVQLWKKFWTGGIYNHLNAIEQITSLLFMKRMDELDLKK